MTQKYIIGLLVLLIIGGAIWGVAVRMEKPGMSPAPTASAAVSESPGALPTGAPVVPAGTNTTGIQLALPPGFSISVFAKNLPGARVLIFDSFGNMWVSQTSSGFVSQLEIENGKVVRQNAVFRGLTKPHGLAFAPEGHNALYIAEENKISKTILYSDAPLTKIADLPSGGGHFTRTLGFGPDGRLYVSIGSSCNVCNESDDRRARIFSMQSDGGDFKEVARGLRNAVFFVWQAATGKMWTTEMGRDNLGDNTPPDEINIIKAGGNYGWPICYGKNIHDTEFDKNTYIRNPCMEPFELPSAVDLPAHSAPLGLAFIPANGNWPKEYRNKLLVAYHGSWNRSIKTGYKLVLIDTETGQVQDFITGWLGKNGLVSGRPVDLKFGPDGALYISDDKDGVVYRVSYGVPPPVPAACHPTGCSGQSCSDQDIITTCEYRAEYVCYQKAKCERQSTGRCGWTQTPELLKCLANPMAN